MLLDQFILGLSGENTQWVLLANDDSIKQVMTVALDQETAQTRSTLILAAELSEPTVHKISGGNRGQHKGLFPAK
jgi:hypothetical protein